MSTSPEETPLTLSELLAGLNKIEFSGSQAKESDAPDQKSIEKQMLLLAGFNLDDETERFREVVAALSKLRRGTE